MVHTYIYIYRTNLLTVVYVPPQHDHMYLYIYTYILYVYTRSIREETNSQEVRVTGSFPLHGQGGAVNPPLTSNGMMSGGRGWSRVSTRERTDRVRTRIVRSVRWEYYVRMNYLNYYLISYRNRKKKKSSIRRY